MSSFFFLDSILLISDVASCLDIGMEKRVCCAIWKHTFWKETWEINPILSLKQKQKKQKSIDVSLSLGTAFALIQVVKLHANKKIFNELPPFIILACSFYHSLTVFTVCSWNAQNTVCKWTFAPCLFSSVYKEPCKELSVWIRNVFCCYFILKSFNEPCWHCTYAGNNCINDGQLH